MKKMFQAGNRSCDGLENMADLGEVDIYEGLDEPISYSRNSKEIDSIYKRRTKSRSRSSSPSSSRLSMQQSDMRTKNEEQYSYRETVLSRDSNNEKGREKIIDTPTPSASLNQEQERAPSTSYKASSFYQAPPSVEGQQQGNYQWQYRRYQESYSRAAPSPPSSYSQSLPLNPSQPPPSHEYATSGRPPNFPPSKWDECPDNTSSTPRQPVTAVEEESLEQKQVLKKQREDHIKRKLSLSRDLSMLMEHENELLNGNSQQKEIMLRQNAEMQDDVQQQLKSVDNVIFMLTDIIGDSANLSEIIRKVALNMEKTSKKVKEKHSSGEKRSERHSTDSEEKHLSRSPLAREENCVYYDTGIHWCSECNVFPKTASDYFDHLHSQQHKQNTKLRFEDFPWHTRQNVHEVSPQYSKEFPPKKIPIRG